MKSCIAHDNSYLLRIAFTNLSKHWMHGSACFTSRIEELDYRDRCVLRSETFVLSRRAHDLSRSNITGTCAPVPCKLHRPARTAFPTTALAIGLRWPDPATWMNHRPAYGIVATVPVLLGLSPNWSEYLMAAKGLE
ncbi:MAG: hypothetical protein ACI9XK_000621 [Granulosicoccus sp.]|jgi:hypothetical protein